MSQPGAPNLIWIFPDEWRHDAVGYAGSPVVSTPAIDALAARGTAFLNATCESPLCQPSRASLLTGRFPRSHGKTHNDWNPDDPAAPAALLNRLMPHRPFPDPATDNILHRLRSSGYRTVEVGKMHFDPDTPLTSYGFDEVAEEHDKHILMDESVETGYTRYLAERGLLDEWRRHQHEQTQIMMGTDPFGRAALPEALAPSDTLDAYIARTACDQVARYAGDTQPFFQWVGFVGPHAPYDGMSPYADRYDPQTLPMGPLGFDGYPDNPWGEYVRYVVGFMNSAHYTESDYRLMAKHYYGRISMIDELIGRIVAAVDRAGIADRTWLFFSSDHGELLGDHGLITKAVFYDTSVRVPALAVPPRGGTPVGARVTDLVQAIDLPTTMLDLAGADTSGLDGRPLIRNGELTSPGRDAVFSEIGAFTMVATRAAKLVVETATRRPQVCYDLRADPDERKDIVSSGGDADLIDHHLALIEEYRNG